MKGSESSTRGRVWASGVSVLILARGFREADYVSMVEDVRGRCPALRAAIDDAAAVAVPSLWPEPFGLIGIEAQARGRPAVGYDVGGIPEWIGDAGIAVPRGDQPALASAIRKVLDERTWLRFAASARRRSESYRLDAHVERFLSLCDAA